jgi:hypothetical protein
MARTGALLALLAALAATGCQTQAQALANDQQMAIDTALRRGRFELGCPGAMGTMLSSNMLQPVVWGGQERAEYTVGVAGCDQKVTYIVLCPQQSDACFAGRGDR